MAGFTDAKGAFARLLEAMGKKVFANTTASPETARYLRNVAVAGSLTAAPILGYMWSTDNIDRKNQELEALLALRRGEPITNLDFSNAPSREEEPYYMDLVADAVQSRVMEKLASSPGFHKQALRPNDPRAEAIKYLTQATLSALVGAPLIGKLGWELAEHSHPLLEDELGSMPISKNITVS